MRNKIIFILSAASLFVAGSALGATKHHYRGYHAYAAGQGYRSTCARANAQWNSEPAAIAIQDKDQAKAVGGRKSTCY
jgi:hypothetical protein